MKNLWLSSSMVRQERSRDLYIAPTKGTYADVKLYRQLHALLVAVSVFKHHAIPKLPSAVKDARDWEKLLVDYYGFARNNVTLLLDQRATKIGVEKALSGLADKNRVSEEDGVLVFFATHGVTLNIGQRRKKGYLVPFDSDVQPGETNPSVFSETCLSFDLVWEKLSDCVAKQVVLVADTCYSGLFAQDRSYESPPNFPPETLRRMAVERARLVLTASTATQKAWEGGFWGQNGALTQAIKEKLEAHARANPGVGLPLFDLAAAVRSRVVSLTRDMQEPQLPMYHRRAHEGDGEFVFVPVEKGSRPAPPVVVSESAPVKPSPTSGSAPRPPVLKDSSLELIYIPAGEFLRGNDWLDDESPSRRIYLDAYWIGKYPVTVAQYRQFCRETKRSMPDAPSWGWIDDHPMVKVTWDEAVAYADWVGGRLPTEAEWEKAARGTDGREYPWGNVWDPSKCHCSKKEWGDAGRTARVGSYPSGASPYGVMDMAGNVWEWCSDWYGEDYYKTAPSRNPQGPSSGLFRVLRGGSWDYYNSFFFRCAYRCLGNPDNRFDYRGFRVARQA